MRLIEVFVQQYLSLIEEVLAEGSPKGDRTGTGTLAKFGTQRTYDLTKGFPLLTTKKLHFKSIVAELLWFISGDTNIKYLVDNNVRIWNEWPYEAYRKSSSFKGETLEDFVALIKNDASFAKKWGNLGPVYGAQWRNFNNEGIDQLKDVIHQIKTNPQSRRLIITAWNPGQIASMALPPCHAFMQFFVNNGELSCQLYQRSADIFLGVPFNIASYALLTHLIAHVTNLVPKIFVHTTGDTHIYDNHREQVAEQLSRAPRPLPHLKLNPQIRSIFDFSLNDIEILDYNPYPAIKAKVAV